MIQFFLSETIKPFFTQIEDRYLFPDYHGEIVELLIASSPFQTKAPLPEILLSR